MTQSKKDGVCYSKPEYIRAKYGESAPIFLTAYQWFVQQAEKLVKKPEGAQFPYWAVAQRSAVDVTGGGTVLTLRVPIEQAVYFDLYDWNKILQLRFLTDDPKEERKFVQELSLRGLDCYKVMMSDFYPEEKQKILQSWERLFFCTMIASSRAMIPELELFRLDCGASEKSGLFWNKR